MKKSNKTELHPFLFIYLFIYYYYFIEETNFILILTHKYVYIHWEKGEKVRFGPTIPLHSCALCRYIIFLLVGLENASSLG